ncbi:MAG: carbohydrate ABC transporter permease [Oscillospiraceae bacterium]|nr:carbohydrate ABC transporter permease [Oscillospiraceae bacterium]
MSNATDMQGQNERIKLTAARTGVYIFMVLVAILCLFPFYLLIINASRSNAELQAGFTMIPSSNFLTNLKTAWNDTSLIAIPKGLLNSFVIAASCCLLCTYFSALTAYGIHVYDFKGKKIAFNFIMVVMMIPTQVSAVGFIQLVSKVGLMNTYWPLIIPSIASPAVFFYMKQNIESTMPLEIIEAARVDGANEFFTFNAIALPMLKPALAVQMIFAFVQSWNNFFTPALIISKKDKSTVPIMLALLRSEMNSRNGDLGEIYMFILLSIVPVVLVYIALSKFIIKGVTMGGVKG